MQIQERLLCDQTLLLVIDVQARLVPAMEAALRSRLIANLVRLGEAQRILGFPVLLTEQYPEGLGATVPEVAAAFPDSKAQPKLCFAAAEDGAIETALLAHRPKSVVVAGMETHICVYQTVRDLRARGFPVLVLRDAVASRTVDNFETGLELVRATGAVVSSTEAVLFDLLRGAGTPEFKQVSRLVR